MRLYEIDNKDRKAVKQLSSVHLSYVLGNSTSEELVTYIDRVSLTATAIVLKEIDLIRLKLYDDLIRILSNYQL